MPTLPQSSSAGPPRRVKTAAREAADLDVETWYTVAASETMATSAAALHPARDPVNAGRTVPVAWAGRCQGCQAPMWAAVIPTRADLTRERRRCPECHGAGMYRYWHVLRQAPPRVPGTRGKGDIAGRVAGPLADPPKQRGFETGFVTPRTRRAPHRGGRPRLYPVPAARQRAYRARLRLVSGPESAT